jgi:hypothetical protein
LIVNAFIRCGLIPGAKKKPMIQGGHSQPMLPTGNLAWAMNLKPEAIVLLGHIVRSWAMIEFTIDSSIRSLIDNHVARKIDTSLIEPLNRRIDLLAELCAEACADKAHVRFVQGILEQIKSEQVLRDMLIHARMMDDAKKPQTHIATSTPTQSGQVKDLIAIEPTGQGEARQARC